MNERVSLTAIGAIVVCLVVAALLGHDGVLLTAGIASISTIAGVHVGASLRGS